MTRRVVDFGNVRLAVVELTVGEWTLTITRPAGDDEPDWEAMERELQEPLPGSLLKG